MATIKSIGSLKLPLHIKAMKKDVSEELVPTIHHHMYLKSMFVTNQHSFYFLFVSIYWMIQSTTNFPTVFESNVLRTEGGFFCNSHINYSFLCEQLLENDMRKRPRLRMAQGLVGRKLFERGKLNKMGEKALLKLETKNKKQRKKRRERKKMLCAKH